jgi:hypothetical protein
VDEEPAANTVGFPAGVAGSFAAGARVAGYRLEKQLGQGGMAVVYLARDERLDRLVALKVLAPALASDEPFRQRFIRESRAAAAVDDPHIIPVFEAGETDGLLYIAATDPDRAARLIADADHIARSITNEYWKAKALAEVATALAATDPDRAERIARSITNEYWKAKVLAEVATALAAAAPDRAEYIARSIVGESYEVSALANLAKALAATAPDRVHLSADARMRIWGLRAIVAVVIMGAFSVWVSWQLGLTLAVIFVIADTIYRSRKGRRQGRLRGAQRAARLIADAERIALSITNKYWKASALAEVAAALAATDADRSAAISAGLRTIIR